MSVDLKKYRNEVFLNYFFIDNGLLQTYQCKLKFNVIFQIMLCTRINTKKDQEQIQRKIKNKFSTKLVGKYLPTYYKLIAYRRTKKLQ